MTKYILEIKIKHGVNSSFLLQFCKREFTFMSPYERMDKMVAIFEKIKNDGDLIIGIKTYEKEVKL